VEDLLHKTTTFMGVSISSEEVVLLFVYIVALLLFFRKISNDGKFISLAAVIVGLGTGVFIWPWAYIIFGWPGASFGAVASSVLGFKTNDLVLVGALFSAGVAMSIVALGVTLLLTLPLKAWKKLRRNQRR
jgi:hypothetical protein